MELAAASSAAAFSRVFTPLRIGRAELANRIGVSAHFAGWWATDGLPNDAFRAYVEERAKGGIGLFVVGATATRYDGGPAWFQNVDDRIVPAYRSVAEAAHRHGTALFAQLIHGGDGWRGPRAGLAAPPLSAPNRLASGTFAPRPLKTADELTTIAASFGPAAARARDGGADGIELHAHESFLHSQILSPLHNQRTDRYGGTLDNRLRLIVETLQAIRAAVGVDLPVGVRLKADEMVPGGMGPSEMAEVIRRLEEAGLIDFVSLTGGDFAYHHGPMTRPDGEWLDLVGRLKAGTRLPVMHAGRITTLEMAEQALGANQLDVALMTKAHIADPHLVRKMRQDRRDDVRFCIRCFQACIGRLQTMTCIYNPVTMREREWADLQPAARRKRVVVVGAGPAGMETAVTAAARGHQVIVLERERRIGGQLWQAGAGKLRRAFTEIADFYRRQANKGRFEVRLDVEADLAAVLALGPEAVVIATGSRPAPVHLPGTGGPVVDVPAALSGALDGRRRVAVVDREGAYRALVVADVLSARGAAVTFLTPFASVSGAVDGMSRNELTARLVAQGVQFRPGVDAVRWANGALLAQDAFNADEERLPDIEGVVIAGLSLSVNGLAAALDSKVPEVYTIGDANQPKTIEEAAYHGGRVGRLL